MHADLSIQQLTENHRARINDEAVSSALLAFLVGLMFGEHTSLVSAPPQKIQVVE